MSSAQYLEERAAVKFKTEPKPCPVCLRWMNLIGPDARGEMRRECRDGHWREIFIPTRRPAPLPKREPVK